MKKILILSSLALVLTACSNDTGSKSKPVINKTTTSEKSTETTKSEEKTTSEKQEESKDVFKETLQNPERRFNSPVSNVKYIIKNTDTQYLVLHGEVGQGYSLVKIFAYDKENKKVLDTGKTFEENGGRGQKAYISESQANPNELYYSELGGGTPDYRQVKITFDKNKVHEKVVKQGQVTDLSQLNSVLEKDTKINWQRPGVAEKSDQVKEETTTEKKEEKTEKKNEETNKSSIEKYAGTYKSSSGESLVLNKDASIDVYGDRVNTTVKEENGIIFLDTGKNVGGLPEGYTLYPSGTAIKGDLSEIKTQDDVNKDRILYMNKNTTKIYLAENSSDKKEEKPEENKSDSKKEESSSNSLSSEKSEALAKGMKAFGEKMNQVPYEKTDVPDKLTWQSGGDVEGYKIYESYIYESGSTTHRYFFVTNSSGTPEVLYSTGGTSVKHTANADIAAMFRDVHGGRASSGKSETSKSSGKTATYKTRDNKTITMDDTGNITLYGDLYVPSTNEGGVIAFKDISLPSNVTNATVVSLVPAGVSSKYTEQVKGKDDASKERIIIFTIGAGPAATEIYFKEGESKPAKSSKLDLDAIAKGDFSSMTGAHGSNFNIDKSTISFKGRQETIREIKREGNVVKIGLPMAWFVVVPAGEPKPHVQGWTGEGFENDDQSRDRAYIFGEGVALVFLD